jgi:hypothetical protein
VRAGCDPIESGRTAENQEEIVVEAGMAGDKGGISLEETARNDEKQYAVRRNPQ